MEVDDNKRPQKRYRFSCPCGVVVDVPADEEPDVVTMSCMGPDRACEIAFEGVVEEKQ